MAKEEYRYLEADEQTWGSKDETITHKMIVMEHIRKIGRNCNVEMRGGYWEKKEHPTKRDEVLEVYIPDAREVFSNSIMFLFDLLYAKLDKETLKKCEEIEEKHDKLIEKYAVKNLRGDYTHKNETERMYYREARLIIMRKMFRTICVWLESNNWLEIGIYTDGGE